MIRFVVGVLLALGAIVGALVLEGGRGTSLLGLSAFLMTWFVPFFGALAVWGWKGWRQAWGAAFRAVDPSVARQSAALWKFEEFTFGLAGILAFLFGLILILGDPAFPRTDWYHPIAAALIAPLYGFFFGYVSRILRARVEAQGTNPLKKSPQG